MRAQRIPRRGVVLIWSPMAGRSQDGGYLLTDTNDPEHMAEHCLQAAVALRSWLNRYSAALSHSGSTSASILSIVEMLEAKSLQTATAA